MLSNTLRMNFCYMKIIHTLHPRYHPKIKGRILKNKPKNKCVCIRKIIRLIITEMKMKMKNRYIPRYIPKYIPRSWHGHKYSKYKKCPIITMFTCVKQHLSIILKLDSWKVKQHWGWFEKKRCLWKSVYFKRQGK